MFIVFLSFFPVMSFCSEGEGAKPSGIEIVNRDYRSVLSFLGGTVLGFGSGFRTVSEYQSETPWLSRWGMALNGVNTAGLLFSWWKTKPMWDAQEALRVARSEVVDGLLDEDVKEQQAVDRRFQAMLEKENEGVDGGKALGEQANRVYSSFSTAQKKAFDEKYPPIKNTHAERIAGRNWLLRICFEQDLASTKQAKAFRDAKEKALPFVPIYRFSQGFAGGACVGGLLSGVTARARLGSEELFDSGSSVKRRR